VVHDQHFRGPVVANTFSVTKSVVVTLAGIADRLGLLPDLDLPLAALLPRVVGTPAAAQTVRCLLTMTRGAQTDGPYDMDVVFALPSGQLEEIASAPQLWPPGERFAYDNGGTHLLAHVLTTAVGEPLDSFAARELFGPLGIEQWQWWKDPDGVPYGDAHLLLSADSLARLGTLWLRGGRHADATLVNCGFVDAMTTPTSAPVPPEDVPYGWLVWVDGSGFFAGGWAGQHVTVVPAADAVVVTTGDPQFDPGPPPRDSLPADWRPARELVVEHLLPVLTG
jgi:CubicO group peptidase (beta-lactamase class C family)